MDVLAIAVSDTKSDIRRLMNENGWGFPVALMPDEVPASYGVRYVPTLVLVDSGGQIVKTWVGGVKADALSAAVDDLTG